jgi:hypothetical protein
MHSLQTDPLNVSQRYGIHYEINSPLISHRAHSLYQCKLLLPFCHLAKQVAGMADELLAAGATTQWPPK